MAIDLQIEGLSKSFGALVLFENISFSIESSQRIGLIARNGKGKSTLLKIIAGGENYDNGSIVFRKDLKVGYLEQEPCFEPGTKVLDACLRRNGEKAAVISRYERATQSGDERELHSALEEMDRLSAWDFESKVKQVLSQLKITDFNQTVETLSGGQMKRVALASILLEEPDLMILDEPTNHLDTEMVEWLEEYLTRLNCSLLMVTHDRYFLDRVCNEIIEIDDNRIYRYKGNYSYFLRKRDERLENAEAEMLRARNLMRKELDWMRRQPQARATKAKYRIDAFYKLEEKAASLRREASVTLGTNSRYIGKKIFEMRALNKAFGHRVIVKDFYYNFARYEKLGIVGTNGTGKSTFIKMLLGHTPQDSGTIEVGETVKWGYYSQDGISFDENMRVIDAVKKIAEVVEVGGKMLTASQFLQHFLFSPSKQDDYVCKLSGGERRRLYLCTVLMSSPNFLVLDEPTNDLDIDTLQVLEEYLADFKGCLIVVSHDRYFMDRVVDHLFVFKGMGEIKDFPGNYTDYRDWCDEEKSQNKAVADAKPKAVKEEKSKPVNPTGKRKMTFNEKREFESLETEIAMLEEEKVQLEADMCSGTLDNDTLLKKSMRVAEVIDMLDVKTMRWLELSEIG